MPVSRCAPTLRTGVRTGGNARRVIRVTWGCVVAGAARARHACPLVGHTVRKAPGRLVHAGGRRLRTVPLRLTTHSTGVRVRIVSRFAKTLCDRRDIPGCRCRPYSPNDAILASPEALLPADLRGREARRQDRAVPTTQAVTHATAPANRENPSRDPMGNRIRRCRKSGSAGRSSSRTHIGARSPRSHRRLQVRERTAHQNGIVVWQDANRRLVHAAIAVTPERGSGRAASALGPEVIS